MDDQLVVERRDGQAIFRQGGLRWDVGANRVTLPGWATLQLEGQQVAGKFKFERVITLMEEDGHAALVLSKDGSERSATLLGGFGRVVHDDTGWVGTLSAPAPVGPVLGWGLQGLHGSEPDGRTGLVHRGVRHFRSADGLWMQPEPLLVLGSSGGELAMPRGLMGSYAAGNVNVLSDPSGFVVESGWDLAWIALEGDGAGAPRGSATGSRRTSAGVRLRSAVAWRSVSKELA